MTLVALEICPASGKRAPRCECAGTGKTTLVEKVAAEGGLPLLALTPSTVLSKWSGESERTLLAIFEAAKCMQPCIIFIDEIDSLAPQRSKVKTEQNRT